MSRESEALAAHYMAILGGVVDINGNIKGTGVTPPPPPRLYKYKGKVYCENCYKFSWNANPRLAHEGICCNCGRTFTKRGEVDAIPMTQCEKELVEMAEKTGGPMCEQIAESVKKEAKERHEKNNRGYRRSRRRR